MDESDLTDGLGKLVQEFEGAGVGPQNRRLAKFAQQAKANRKKLEMNTGGLQELLDYLRVCIKYQLFDLEATRRENQFLRKLLQEHDDEQ